MIDAFHTLKTPTRDKLLKSGREFHAAKGAQILQADEPWNTAFWIESGAVRMYYLDRDGNEHNKRFFIKGGFFWPVTSSLREQATGFTIEALVPCVGLSWSFCDLKSAFDDVSEWLEFNQFWAERLLSDKLKRERELLQLSATERYLALCRDEAELIEVVPAHHLASYIGITPVSLSRIKKSIS